MSDSSYILQNEVTQDEEMQRLDDLHHCITSYLGGRLSFAPLETSSPSAILELGSGSGAWAIQAAKQFPTAQITAVDMVELPHRELPPNLEFKKMDLVADPLPFKPASFDVVHARLVMIHLPHAVDILRRAMHCLRPGGWLLVEEPADDCFQDDGGPPGPHLEALLTPWHRSMREKEVEPCIGRMLSDELRCFDGLADVNSHYIDIPLSNQSSVPVENQLGAAWQRSIKRILPILQRKLSAHGITTATMDGVLKELEDPEKKLTTRLYFTWSQKS